MNLHVIVYPELEVSDMERIQSSRKEHNSLYEIIGAHFTLVFAVGDMPESDFVEEVKKQARGISQIPFCLRVAVVNRDVFSLHYDTFLVPDEGFSRIVKLHDKLYSDKLSPHHRLDISYIPHISIASNADPLKIKKITDHWNAQEFAIKGMISFLDVINYENRKITTLEKIPLR